MTVMCQSREQGGKRCMAHNCKREHARATRELKKARKRYRDAGTDPKNWITDENGSSHADPAVMQPLAAAAETARLVEQFTDPKHSMQHKSSVLSQLPKEWQDAAGGACDAAIEHGKNAARLSGEAATARMFDRDEEAAEKEEQADEERSRLWRMADAVRGALAMAGTSIGDGVGDLARDVADVAGEVGQAFEDAMGELAGGTPPSRRGGDSATDDAHDDESATESESDSADDSAAGGSDSESAGAPEASPEHIDSAGGSAPESDNDSAGGSAHGSDEGGESVHGKASRTETPKTPKPEGKASAEGKTTGEGKPPGKSAPTAKSTAEGGGESKPEASPKPTPKPTAQGGGTPSREHEPRAEGGGTNPLPETATRTPTLTAEVPNPSLEPSIHEMTDDELLRFIATRRAMLTAR